MSQNMTSLPPASADQKATAHRTSNDPTPISVSPLVRYGLTGLRRCWSADHGRWSYKYHLDGRINPNEIRPRVDLYYSLNVLLGLAPIRPLLATEPYDVPVMFASICRMLPDHPVRNGAWGMALWAAAELGLDVPGIAVDRLQPIANNIDSIAKWTAQDVGLTLSGVTAQLRHDAAWSPLAHGLRDVLMARFRGPGALFRDSGKGVRHYFATFATQIYAALALYQFAEFAGDTAALAAANACAEKLITLQGPLGEWPWFYSPHHDRVLDPYEVYSVHQHGMAPAMLHHAERHGVPGARVAIERGFQWVFGANQMGSSMLIPSLHLIFRSQARQGMKGHRIARLMRATMAATAKSDLWKSRPALRLTPEMRSYELGWLLWSFGACETYPALTHHAGFRDAFP